MTRARAARKVDLIAVKDYLAGLQQRIVARLALIDGGAFRSDIWRRPEGGGGESRVIDLRGVGQRSLRRIDFWYDTKGVGRGTADVTVFGMK